MWLWLVYGVAVLVVVAPVILLLAVRIVRIGAEIARYARDIRSDARRLADDLEPAGELATTAALAASVRANVTRYAAALGRVG